MSDNKIGNVLSLFDGMSCGQIALNKLGIEYEGYYASEVDEYAIKVSKDNFPNMIHLGDVTKVNGADLPKIDLLIGGSPCQGFSFAGKQLNFNDPRSKLFFEYVRLLHETKPRYFLLENVMMKKEYQDVISKHLGVEPILINSSLLSAQNRKRLYWTNIPGVGQPENLKKRLIDILEPEVDKKYFLSEKIVQGFLNKTSVFGDRFLPLKPDEIAGTLTARYYKQSSSDPYIFDIPKRLGVLNKGGQRDRIYDPEHKSIALSALGEGRGAKTGLYLVPLNYSSSGRSNKVVEGRMTKLVEKAGTLTSGGYGNRSFTGVEVLEVEGEDVLELGIRRLTPLECKRLQTVPDEYKMDVSDTQAYKMLGNGWTVDVIAHILKQITDDGWTLL